MAHRQRIEHAHFEAFPPLGSEVLVGHPGGELRDTLSLAVASDDRLRLLWMTDGGLIRLPIRGILSRSNEPRPTILLGACIRCTH